MNLTWKDAIVKPETPLASVIELVDASGLQIALVLSDDQQLLGVITDGNIRRAILSRKNLQIPASEIMTLHPTTVRVSTPRDEMISLMRSKLIHHLPVVDDLNHVVDLVTVDDFIRAFEQSSWVVLMAGGLGTRLHPLTEQFPKPLLSVGGKPILETILESFVEEGFKRFFFSVNYRAEQIRDHFGSGEKWGATVEYLHESSRLGTAGALSLLPEKPTTPLLVMNGDLLTRVNFTGLLRFHNDRKVAATMAVREYDYQVPYGVVNLDGENITGLVEKPLQTFFVNAGIYVLSPATLDLIPARTFYNMTSLFEHLLADGKPTAAYPLREYWLDIGQIEEFEKAHTEWVEKNR